MINYITESVETVIDVLSIVIGEGFSTAREDTFTKYYNLIPLNF